MLKGRGKTFAPKKVPARKPGATPVPASTRPGIDRQSQSSVPSQQLQDLPAVAEKEIASSIPAVNNVRASSQDVTQTAGSTSTPTTSTSDALLKRKEREEDTPAPLAKRHAAELDHSASQTNTAPAAQKVPSPSKSNTSIHAPAGTLKPNDPERKGRAPLPSAPPAKANASSKDANIEFQPSQHGSSQAAQLAGKHGLPGTSSGQGPDTPADSGHARNTEPSPGGTSGGLSHTRNRYPSPENMVRITDDVPTVSLSADGGAGRVNVASSGAAGSSDIVEMASLNPDGTSGGIIEEPLSGTEKGRRKVMGNAPSSRRRVQENNDAEDDRATVSVSLNGARRAAAAKRPRKKRDAAEVERRRRVRAATPEGASDEEIDVTVMTMGDLTKDLKIGKRFSRYAEIKEMEELKKREAMKAKMRRKHPELASLLDANGQSIAGEPISNAPVGGAAIQSEGGHSSGANEREASPEPPQGIVSGPRMRLLNGRMILDETSLTIDRHANAQLEREGMEIVEENDFSRIVTQGTYMKREPSQSWDPAANQLFYKGLRQFGTDFEMIAAMFPHRNRRQIKLKFNKEEKVNAAKINRILMNPKEPIDLDQFEKMSDKKLEPLEVIHAEREKYDAEQREEIAKFAEASAEATRKKKESIKGSEAARRILSNMSDESDAEEGVGGSNKENTGKGKKKRAVTKKGRRGKNDDPGEIVGTIE